MEIITIENLCFAYPQEKNCALQDISLKIDEGEFITLCGKSGCGKSTLLRHLKPILTPHGEKGGRVYFLGKDISELSQREDAGKIGFVFQNPDNQIVTDKVWHELAFGLENLSYSQTEIRTRVSEMASFFGIGDWFYKNVSELSGGQKQLLNLASVMVMQPCLLVLDEPTSQLDPISAEDFLRTVYKINRELGITVILSEHRLEEALPLSDRVIVMDNGKIIADDTPQNVGEILSKTENDMFCAMPTAMRVYYSKESGLNCPVTIRDARKWLCGMPINDVKLEEKSPKEGKVALSLSEVYFRYEKNMPDVLRGASLTINEGELYALVGSNGSGKTTMLSVIAGLNKHYRGKVTVEDGKKVAMLVQNPQSLFVKNTVVLDLCEMLCDAKLTKEEKEEKLQEIIGLCELSDLLGRYSYDLSGGEQQRLALAKVLLTEPDILLLDEPTKGLDAHFKEKLAGILIALQKNGMTILMVSHDIEFCAKYADRCGMFFDGVVTSEATPKKFFAGKNFYTTSANKIARGMIDGAVLDEDIIKAIGGVAKEKKSEIAPKPTSKSDLKNNSEIIREQGRKKKPQLKKQTITSVIMILLLIPLTILAGVYLLDDRKYYFISMLIIFETMLPFALIFEGRKPQAREIVIISVLCAIAVAGRCAFAMLPQFKPVVALVIVAGVCFGGEAGFLVGAITGFVSNFFFGQTPFTPWQMFAFGIIGFLAGVLFRKGKLKKRTAELCIYGFLSTLIIYGGVMNAASVIVGQINPTKEMFLTSFAFGFPYDLIHALSTSFFLLIIAKPMIDKLDRIKIKYGLVE